MSRAGVAARIGHSRGRYTSANCCRRRSWTHVACQAVRSGGGRRGARVTLAGAFGVICTGFGIAESTTCAVATAGVTAWHDVQPHVKPPFASAPSEATDPDRDSDACVPLGADISDSHAIAPPLPRAALTNGSKAAHPVHHTVMSATRKRTERTWAAGERVTL
jgi:hypothetical protein